MIQDISPLELKNRYVHKTVTEKSVVFAFNEEKILCCNQAEIRFPLYEQLTDTQECIFLFEIDGTDYFMAKQSNVEAIHEFTYESIEILRSMKPKFLAFAGITAYHLFCWYRDNSHCGRCGSTFLQHSTNERALVCTKCDNQIFPKIAPAVIIGIIDGDKLLMTKSAISKYKHFALVAGFIEVGENAEDAVRREVMEEVGVKVKDIRYYKSQPWGFSGSLLLGYYANLDGSPDLCIESSELSTAVWIKREDIENKYEDFSLTNNMICKFKDGTIDFL